MFALTLGTKTKILLAMVVSLFVFAVASTSVAAAYDPLTTVAGTNQCGSGEDKNKVETSMDLGCKATGNAIFDFLFALLRFMSVGIGIVLVISMIIVGIQYSWARGDPGAVAKAKDRMLYIFIALLIYILAFAALNYLVPGNLLEKA
jgi:hypothetical protein